MIPDNQLGFVERLGPLTVATIRGWRATSRFTLLPVLDRCRTDAVVRPIRATGVDGVAHSSQLIIG